jgi:hypothetical protein
MYNVPIERTNQSLSASIRFRVQFRPEWSKPAEIKKTLRSKTRNRRENNIAITGWLDRSHQAYNVSALREAL